MTHSEKLEALCQKFGPVEVSRMLGVQYPTIWRWRTMKNGIPRVAMTSLDYVYGREFSEA